jgi:hypothetical protein
MTALLRAALAATLFAVFFASPARGEAVLSVNVVPGVFDQPSMVLDGNTAHVAFIGADDIAGPFLLYYAAVDGGADFGNLNLIADNILLTQPVPVLDTAGSPDNTYTDARHPKIARRTASELVIFFQAKPAADDIVFSLYRALVTTDNNAVGSILVSKVGGEISPGDIQDLSFGLVAADNTARVAYASRPAADPSEPFQVHYARIGLDDAAVVGTPILLSSGDGDTVTGSDGIRPLPSLVLDSLNRAHVAWAANDDDASAGAIYYALVKEIDGTDNLAIGATKILDRPLNWVHPSVLAPAANSILVLAGDAPFPGFGGLIGLAQVNPDAVVHTGLPVSTGNIRSFLVKGPTLLSHDFNLYRPEALLDGRGRIHLTGYGISGSGATYYVFQQRDAFPYAEFVIPPVPVGLNEFPAELDGDYTKAAFGFLNGKSIVFWSSRFPGNPDRRDLRVTTVPSVFDAPPTQESGCTIVRNRDRGASGRIPGDLLILLPAIVLGFRRFLRRRLAT